MRTQRIVYLVGAVVVVLTVYVWGEALSRPNDAAAADGDPDAGALELVAFAVVSAVALAAYAVLIALVEVVIRSNAKRSGRVEC